ncbi:unnamed protein product [Miscanthus lutarioriparius]|uniref:Hexosyltransferase n=1 Tax=Miscanthus lutarioriparius TaxID=422564 RepID=A0A811PA78_9POAL|nr:unnamed protein product [Miscanthus lutarioriparius]
MRVYITATATATAGADDATKPKVAQPQPQKQQAARRGCRSAAVTGLLAGLLLFRAALLAIEAGASLCPSTTGCLDWRAGLGRWLYGDGGDATEEFMKEWRRHREATLLDPVVVGAAPDSLDALMAEMATMLASYDRIDMEAVAIKMMAMLLKMDRKVKSSRIRAVFNRHLASLGIPKSVHCLALRLAEEFAVNSAARSPVPPPEHAPRLTDASCLHVALVTDNVLAAAVAVASAARSAADPARLVFHVVTDKKSYVPMHSWFALHPVSPAVVEVRGLHQFDWRDAGVVASVMRTVEEFFPELGRVMLLDDDVVVRKDLAGLWEQDLDGNIIGAVGAHEGSGVCIDKTFGDHLNFSDPDVSGLHSSQCAWSWGVNIVDLDAWRRTNVTETYQFWSKQFVADDGLAASGSDTSLRHVQNRESGFRLWQMASLPPALIAFDGRVQAIEPLWNLPGLGWRVPHPDLVRFSAVLHFSGPRKPWLEVAFPELRQLWLAHLNASDSFLQGCGVVEWQ